MMHLPVHGHCGESATVRSGHCTEDSLYSQPSLFFVPHFKYNLALRIKKRSTHLFPCKIIKFERYFLIHFKNIEFGRLVFSFFAHHGIIFDKEQCFLLLMCSDAICVCQGGRYGRSQHYS